MSPHSITFFFYSASVHSPISGGGASCSYRGRGCDHEVWCGWGSRAPGYMAEGWTDLTDRRQCTHKDFVWWTGNVLAPHRPYHYVYKGIVSKFSIYVPNRCLWNAVVYASFLVGFPVSSCQDIRCCKIHMSGWEYGRLNREVLQVGSSGYATSHLYLCLNTARCSSHFIWHMPSDNWQCANL